MSDGRWINFRAVDDVLLRSRQSGNNLLVMIAIAKHMGRGYENPGAFRDDASPSIATIAKIARVSGRTVQRIIRKLEEAGELKVYRSEGRECHLFEIHLPNGDISDIQRCHPVQSTVTQLCQGNGDTAMSPEESIQIKKENRKEMPDYVGRGLASSSQSESGSLPSVARRAIREDQIIPFFGSGMTLRKEITDWTSQFRKHLSESLPKPFVIALPDSSDGGVRRGGGYRGRAASRADRDGGAAR